MSRTTAFSRLFDQACAEILSRPAEPEIDLPATLDGSLVDPEAAKTPARRSFERSPSSFLRRPGQGLLPLMNLTSDNPNRPVDAGWQIVCSQVHGRFRPTAVERDPWIERGHGYLQMLLDCREVADHEKLACEMPGVHAAYTIYRSPDKFLRGRFEAYLLSTRFFEDIAVDCALPLAVVEAYERLFFCVRSRLKHSVLIRSIAFDDKFWDGLKEDDIDLILKMAALLGGCGVLKPMIRYYSSVWGIPDRSEGFTRSQVVELHEMLGLRALILAWVLPPSKIQRAFLFNEFVDELGQLIKGWPADAAVPKKSPFGSTPISANQFETWWASWCETIDLALRKLPADMSLLRDVA